MYFILNIKFSPKTHYVIITLLFQTDSILNRIHVAEPKKRDSQARPAFIPEAVFKKREMKKAGMEIDSDGGDDEDDDTMITDGKEHLKLSM